MKKVKNLLTKIMSVVEGQYGNARLLNLIFAMFFIFLGINAIFMKNGHLPTSLIVINWAMTLLGLSYLVITVIDTYYEKLEIFLEYLTFVLLGINAYLAFEGINDHADPISLAMIGYGLWFIKVRNLNNVHRNRKAD